VVIIIICSRRKQLSKAVTNVEIQIHRRTAFIKEVSDFEVPYEYLGEVKVCRVLVVTLRAATSG
jgi:hypothetical protein